jgi:hypothetical protein
MLVQVPGVASEGIMNKSEEEFDIIFSLSKKDLKKAIDAVDIKEFAYSLYDKAEDKVS